MIFGMIQGNKKILYHINIKEHQMKRSEVKIEVLNQENFRLFEEAEKHYESYLIYANCMEQIEKNQNIILVLKDKYNIGNTLPDKLLLDLYKKSPEAIAL